MSKAHRTTHRPIHAPVRHTPNLSVAPFEGFDRAASLPVPQELTDDQLAGFTEGELKLALTVIRATNGGQREGISLSVRALCNGGVPDVLPGRGTGLSPRTVQAASSALETAGFLRVTRRMAPDGSGLPSLFSLPLVMPGMGGTAETPSPRFPGYNAARRVRLPLLVIDRLLAELSGAELKVLLYVLRHTFCVGLADEVMPMARLVENTGLSLRHTRLAVAGLSTRGLILVQHRQDPERGKIPSRFGVRVLGEASPFATVAPTPGIAARSVRADEPIEPARPVWLVPSEPGEPVPAPAPEPVRESAPVASQILQVFPPMVAPRAPVVQPDAVSPDPISLPIAPPPAVSAASAVRASIPAVRRSIPVTMTRDASPVWAAVKRLLADRLPYHYFAERVAPTSSVGSGGVELLIAVQNEHHRWWMESKLGSQVRQALIDAGYPDQRLRYLNYVAESQSERDSHNH